MLMLQSRQDVEKAVELVTEALEIDKKCDFAYETLATLEVQRQVVIMWPPLWVTFYFLFPS